MLNTHAPSRIFYIQFETFYKKTFAVYNYLVSGLQFDMSHLKIDAGYRISDNLSETLSVIYEPNLTKL